MKPPAAAASGRSRLLNLAKAQCKTQIDTGFGHAITPGPVAASYPVRLPDLPAPTCTPGRRTPPFSRRAPAWPRRWCWRKLHRLEQHTCS